MKLDYLRQFITLASKLNFSEAAKIHFITQPVLSKHIAFLEEQLQTQLFERNKQSVQITDLGKVFLKDAKEIVATYDEAIDRLQDAKEGYCASLRIAYVSSAAQESLPSLIKRFSEKYANVRLQLSCCPSTAIYEMLDTGKADLGIVMQSDSFSDASYRWYEMYSDPLCVVAPADHSLAKKKAVHLSDFSENPLLSPSPHNFYNYDEFLKSLILSEGIAPHFTSEFDTIESCFMMIESSSSLAILPKNLRGLAPSDLSFIPIIGKKFHVHTVLTSKRNNKNPYVGRFVCLTKQHQHSNSIRLEGA